MKEGFKKLQGNSLLAKMENNTAVIAMRGGVLLAIPFLLAGSFCIILTSFPSAAYQGWVQSVFDGMLYQMIMWMYNATMGNVSLLLILGVSYNYGSQMEAEGKEELGFYMLTSFAAYVLFAAESIHDISLSIFDSTWMFTAIIVTLLSCAMLQAFLKIYRRYIKPKKAHGIDRDFKSTMYAMVPIIQTLLVFLLIKMVFVHLAGTNVQNIGTQLCIQLFGYIGTGFLGSLVFIFLIHMMWFFGIHGSNMLSAVSDGMFEPGMLENMRLVAEGGAPVHLFTKTYFDVFVLMGGSGATLCLLLALLASKKGRIDKKLFGISIIPSLFNVNEIVLFGLPVIFNPVMIIPFILVPVVIFLISTAAVMMGLVPIPSAQISWTTPIFLSGYMATGSWRAVCLQAVNLFVGTVIYRHFLQVSGVYNDNLLVQNIENLKKEMILAEEEGRQVNFKKGGKNNHETVKRLTRDLRRAISSDEIVFHYQPQICNDGSVFGVEALLRWKHPVAGYLYPPLVIELARQDNLLDEMGIMLIEKAAGELQYLSEKLKRPIHMAVNISPVQFESDRFCGKVKEILGRYTFHDSVLCFEVTEQMALSNSDAVTERIEELRKAGISFHMDDFGMGHSSMRYLQSNEFEAVKLDGILVRQILKNNRSQDIISGIQKMSSPLNYELIAEYVETEEQKKVLERLGCYIYQGALYSMAMPLEELEHFLEEYQCLEMD